MTQKILLAEDDAGLRGHITRYLSANSLSVAMTDNGSEALLLVRESRPNLVLIDAEMPGLDGHAVCRVLKQRSDTRTIPVILMSGVKVGERDMLAGYEYGADDYILKPFSLAVLLAKIQAFLRRCSSPFSASGVLHKQGIELDPEARTVKRGGKFLPLTPKEFDLLSTLMSKPGRVLSATYLLETVWNYDLSVYNDPETVAVHVCRLRRKLGPVFAKHIINVVGHGYRFED